MIKPHHLAVLMMSLYGSVALAGGTILTGQKESAVLYEPVLHQYGERLTYPKPWNLLKARERAEIWPLLSPKMQRFYWQSMTRADRHEMEKLLSPHSRHALRFRFVLHDRDCPEAHGYRAKDHSERRPRLTLEERARLREQIRDFHIQLRREMRAMMH